MKNCNQDYYCKDLANEVDVLNMYRASKKDKARIVENINVVRELLKTLYRPNSDILIDLLSYDAYNFFINSKNDIETTSNYDKCLDMSVHNPKENGTLKSGYLTEAHYDDGIYYGSFHVTYTAENGDELDRDFVFNAADTLLIQNTVKKTKKVIINGKPTEETTQEVYFETVYDIEGELYYSILGPTAGCTCDSKSLPELLNVLRKSDNIRLSFFPEVTHPEYFKDYDVATRGRN
ncbi:MAG: hypothetical protein IKX00_03825 [Bacilli bacterium]|nr:hypothetical protein [Bacilli bacterium]